MIFMIRGKSGNAMTVAWCCGLLAGSARLATGRGAPRHATKEAATRPPRGAESRGTLSASESPSLFRRVRQTSPPLGAEGTLRPQCGGGILGQKKLRRHGSADGGGAPGVGVPGVDPSPDEVSNLNTYDEAATWAGVSVPVRTALHTQLGGPITVLRQIVLLTYDGWASAVDTATKDAGAVLSHLEKTSLYSLRRVARLRLGLAPGDDPAALAIEVADQERHTQAQLATAQAAAAVAAPPSASRVSHKEVKLSAVIDPTLNAEVVPLSHVR